MKITKEIVEATARKAYHLKSDDKVIAVDIYFGQYCIRAEYRILTKVKTSDSGMPFMLNTKHVMEFYTSNEAQCYTVEGSEEIFDTNEAI